MNSYLLTGATMICAGKLQQCAGRLIGSRKHRILGFDLELRGRTVATMGAASRAANMGLQQIRIRGRR